jgi:hypothetical protein
VYARVCARVQCIIAVRQHGARTPRTRSAGAPLPLRGSARRAAAVVEAGEWTRWRDWREEEAGPRRTRLKSSLNSRSSSSVRCG